eukprot:272682-Rhodomonas_salina.2
MAGGSGGSVQRRFYEEREGQPTPLPLAPSSSVLASASESFATGAAFFIRLSLLLPQPLRPPPRSRRRGRLTYFLRSHNELVLRERRLWTPVQSDHIRSTQNLEPDNQNLELGDDLRPLAFSVTASPLVRHCRLRLCHLSYVRSCAAEARSLETRSARSSICTAKEWFSGRLHSPTR